jgi:two-component sensor histidine kinase
VAQKLQRLLLAEMHHRIKNMLAMVQSRATQSLRTAKTLEDAREAISDRIVALARTHDILLSSDGDAVQLPALVANMAAPFGEQNFSIDVPDIQFPSAPAISISLVMNELCTNAVKYGALSTPNGRVCVTGHLDETKTLILTWAERGGPPVQPQSHRSFGTQLIETATPGECRLEFRPDGVVCEMRIELPRAKSLSGHFMRRLRALQFVAS